MSSEPPVLYTVANNIAHLVMNRPGAMNAMSGGMITELRQALERAQSDPDVSIIVLTGAGNNFCAGDDLKESEHQAAQDFLALILDLQRITRLLLLGGKPASRQWMAMPWVGASSWLWPAIFVSPAHERAWDVWKRV